MFKAILLDLDGTVYKGDRPIDGAVPFLERLKKENIPYLFVTNRANRTQEEINSRLLKMGIFSTPEKIITSSIAAADFLEPDTVYIIGEKGLSAALTDKGFVLTEEHPRYVIVSLDTTLTYEKLEKACLFIRGGAEFVATNNDHFVHSEKGISPGAGAIVAALSKATRKKPIIIGKPEVPLMKMALSILSLPPDEILMVGDNPETDIMAGRAVGTHTALILTGALQKESITSHVKADWVISTYQELEELVFNN